MVARLARDHDVTPGRARTSISRDHADVRDAISALAPQAIVNCARYNDVDGAEDEQVTRASTSMRWWSPRWRGRPPRPRRGLPSLQHGLRLRRHRVGCRTPRPSSPSRAASTRNRSWSASGWPPTAPQHYVLRVESLFGGPQRRSSVDRIVDAVRSGAAGAGVLRSRRVAKLRRRRGRASALLLRDAAAVGLYHCVNSGHATWLERRPGDCQASRPAGRRCSSRCR